MKPLVIGLYGGSGAGKTQAAHWFAGRGVPVVDADAVSREVSAPHGSAYSDIRAAFPDCFREDGTLNRRKLGSIVFTDPEARQRLEAAVQPHMRTRIQELLSEVDGPLAVLDCAVLLSPAFRDLADERWLITAPEAVRRDRLTARDDLSEERIQERLDAQTPEEELRQYADRVIVNDGSAAQLAEKLSHVEAEIFKKT